MTQPETTTRDLLRRVLPIIAIAWVFLPLTFVVPWLNSTGSPYFDLTGWIGTVAHRLAVLGGSKGTPWIVGSLILVVVSRPGLAIKRRVVEALALAVVTLTLLGGGSAFNEFVIKRTFKEPRPHIKLLARTPTDTPPEASILKMSADSLYRLDKATRRAYIEEISGYDELISAPASRRLCFEEYGDELHLNQRVCRHWASTTGGYSFPSGHAYSAMFLATFFLGLALYALAGWRLAFFQFLVVPYGVLVCYSRTVLRVHSPLDISVGGLLGVLFGLAGIVLVVAVLKKIGSDKT